MNITVTKESQNDFKELKECGGIDLSEGATAEFPALATSGSIWIREGATAEFPTLATSGNIWIREGATAKFPTLETSGDIWISEGATADFSALATSGNIDLREGATLKHTLLDGLDYKSVDNILFVIESQKTVKGITILIGYNLKRFEKGEAIKEHCFVSEKDNFFAHGNTVKKAIEDLNFKIISEKLKNDPITEKFCTPIPISTPTQSLQEFKIELLIKKQESMIARFNSDTVVVTLCEEFIKDLKELQND
jgi:hypothetical protein